MHVRSAVNGLPCVNSGGTTGLTVLLLGAFAAYR